MPGPPTTPHDGNAIESITSGPSIALQLHGEFQNFRSKLLIDMKSLLQAALQEVLDKHQVLVNGQEELMRDFIEQTTMTPLRTKTDSHMFQSANKSVGSRKFQTIDEVFTSVEPETIPKPKAFESAPSQESKKSTHGRNSKRAPSVFGVQTQGANKRITFFGETNPWLKDEADIAEDPYDVTEYYHDRGCVQWLVRSTAFNNLTLMVICANAVYMGIDANSNKADSILDADWWYRFCQNLFCAFFTLEILCRFKAFRYKRYAFYDGWFRFDLLLVILMVVETWVYPLILHVVDTDYSSEPLKLVRLLRLARITRLLRVFPELVTMVKGLLEATRAVASALVLMGFMIYAFSILIHSFEKDVPEMQMFFSTLPLTMWTLLVNGVLVDDVGAVIRSLRELREIPALIAFMVFVLLSAVTVMNMLIGVLCEVVNEVKSVEKENADRNQVRQTLLVMLRDLDADGSGHLSIDEMRTLMEHPEALEVLHDLKVDVGYYLRLQDMLFEAAEGRGLSISKIVSTILTCRGERPTTMQDLVNASTYASYYTGKLLEAQEQHLQQSMMKYMQAVLTKIFELNRKAQVVAANEPDPNRLVDQLQYWLYINGMVETGPGSSKLA